MNESPQKNPSSISYGKLFLFLLPMIVVVVVGVEILKEHWQSEAVEKTTSNTVSRLLGNAETALRLSNDYSDQDGDLVADPPQDPAKCINPVELTFAAIASADNDDPQATWQELIDAIASKVKRKVNVVRYADTGEQLRALRNGQLHITTFGTGAVPMAVNAYGFVPVCTLGRADGSYGYMMKIIVPGDSEIHEVEDMRGKRMTFTRPRSNSGYKAALVFLMDEHNMQIERDYAWGFSYGHDNSIRGIASKEFQAAAVASDLLNRMVVRGDIEADAIRSIYESEKFPPSALGYSYNLAPELRAGIRETLLQFNWAGTGLEKAFGPFGASQFTAVSYKDDWDNVRRIDNALAKARRSMER
jgi:phosphonate transport system substrate-binding protein